MTHELPLQGVDGRRGGALHPEVRLPYHKWSRSARATLNFPRRSPPAMTRGVPQLQQLHKQ